MLFRQESEVLPQGMECLVYRNEILINTCPPLVHRSRKTRTNPKVNQDLSRNSKNTSSFITPS